MGSFNLKLKGIEQDFGPILKDVYLDFDNPLVAPGTSELELVKQNVIIDWSHAGFDVSL